MSPELFGAYSVNGQVKAPVTQAVDVYSFGVLMWEVLSGEKPSRTTSLRRIRCAPCWHDALLDDPVELCIIASMDLKCAGLHLLWALLPCMSALLWGTCWVLQNV